MGRAPCCVKEGLKKGPWTLDEDHKLTSYIAQHGHGSWRALPAKAGLLRCGKSCRLRWNNYLRPDIKRGQFSPSDDQTILQLHAMLGNRWAAIASHLPMRTDNEIKNYWNTQLKKRLIKMGVDPATHKPKTSLQDEKYTGNSTALLSHITQWETARVEAEARLAKESHMRAKGIWPPSSIKRDISTPDVSSSSRNICVSTQSSDLLSDSDAADHLGKWEPCPEIDASELINDFQTWEKSLQGQAGRISTDSSKLSGRSCSSSPLVDRITDTSSFSCIVPRRSWTDIMSYLPLQTNSTNFILTPPSPLNTDQVDDLGQSTSDAVPFQDMVFALSVDDSTFENSVPWSPISEGPVDMDVYERYLDSIPSLVSATTSSNVLDEIDLVSEDISSSKNSSVDFGGISSESLLALSILLDEQPCESQLQSTNHNALDLSREFSEDWSNILMQLE